MAAPFVLKTRLAPRSQAFALMDVMIALVVVGIAVSAIVQLFLTGTQSNVQATRLTIAGQLAENIHEYALTLPHRGPNGRVGITAGETPATANDITDLNNWTCEPAVDSMGRPLAGFKGWSQEVHVLGVSGKNLLGTLSSPVGSEPKRLVVTVNFDDKPVITRYWLMAPTLKLTK